MALGPIELNMMVGRAQDVSAIKQNEDLRPMTEQTAFQNQIVLKKLSLNLKCRIIMYTHFVRKCCLSAFGIYCRQRHSYILCIKSGSSDTIQVPNLSAKIPL